MDIVGSSFLTQQGGGSIVTITRDDDEGTITFQGCMQFWGQNQFGTVTFTKILNPDYKRNTDSFTIQIAADPNFD